MCGSRLFLFLIIWFTSGGVGHAGNYFQAVQGTLSTGELGSARYTLPLQLPKSSGGFGPNVGLSYDSNSPDRLAGPGWSVFGLSQVSRCASTKGQQGKISGIQFGKEGPFCLDGKLLVAVEGSYGDDATVYRTENETFSRVISHGKTGFGPEWFSVETKSGLYMTFGKSGSSRRSLGSPNNTLEWGVEEVVDQSSNYWTVQYESDLIDGWQRPKSIRFSGNKRQHLDTINSIEFDYHLRKVRPRYFVGGQLATNPFLIDRIRVLNDNRQVVEYSLTYETSPITHGERLKEVSLCATSAQCAIPLRLDWEANDLVLTATGMMARFPSDQGAFNLRSCLTGAQLQPVDLNIDGRTDFLCSKYDGASHVIQTFLSESKLSGEVAGEVRFSDWRALHQNNGSLDFKQNDSCVGGLLFADINGDGLPDLACVKHRPPAFFGAGPPNQYETSVHVQLADRIDQARNATYSKWTQWLSPVPENSWNREKCGQIKLVDLQGDGRAGLLCTIETDNAQLLVHSLRASDSKFEFVQREAGGSAAYGRCRETFVVDVNGDGLPDLLCVARAARPLDVDAKEKGEHLAVRVNQNGVFAPQAIWSRFPSFKMADCGKMTAADVNGDGQADLVCLKKINDRKLQIEVALNTTQGFEPWKLWSGSEGISTSIELGDLARVTVSDANGDGRADIVIGAKSALATELALVSFSSGERFNEARSPTIRSNGSGDDLKDLIPIFAPVSGSRSLEVIALKYDDKTSELSIYGFRNASSQEVVTRFYNRTKSSAPDQTGSYVEVKYAPLGAQVDHVEPKRLSKNVLPVSRSLYVVSETSTPGADGKAAKRRYHYSGLRHDVSRRMNVGFELIEATHVADAKRMVTKYGQEHPFVGLPYWTEEWNTLANRLVRRTQTSWGIRSYQKNWISPTSGLPLISLGDCNGIGKDMCSGSIRSLIWATASYLEVPIMTLTGELTAQAVLVSIKEPNEQGVSYFPFARETQEVVFLPEGGLLNAVTTTNAFDDFGNLVESDSVDLDSYRVTKKSSFANDPIKWRLGQLRSATTMTANSRESSIRTAAFEYDSLSGSLMAETVEPGSADYLKTSFTRDEFGNVLVTTKETALGSRSARSVFDDKGRFAVLAFNELGHTVKAKYSDKFGGILERVDANGRVEKIVRDEFDSVLSVEKEGRDRTDYSRELCGDVECPEGGLYVETASRSDGSEARRVFGPRDLIVEEAVRGVDGVSIITRHSYDSGGRGIRTQGPGLRDRKLPEEFVERDSFGRVTKRTFNDGSMARIEYNNLQKTLVDAKSRRVKAAYDRQGRLATLTAASGIDTSYEYDLFGHATRISRQGTEALSAKYDALGRRISTTTPEGGQTVYSYNPFGELVGQTNSNGKRLLFEYDALGRMTKRDADGEITVWAYDMGPGTVGAISEIKHGRRYVEKLERDSLGRLTSRIFVIGGNRFSFGYEYDKANRLSQLRYPNGFEVEYGYGVGNVIGEIRNAKTGFLYWRATGLNPLGQIERAELGNGLIVQNSYDAASGRLIGQSASLERGARPVQDLSYQYDEFGSLIVKRDLVSDLKQFFTYDADRRLTRSEVLSERPVETSYNDQGNIVRKSDTGEFKYGERGYPDSVLTSASSHRLEYDAVGNQKRSYDGEAVAYNSIGQPRSISSGGWREDYRYGPNNELIETIVSAPRKYLRSPVYLGREAGRTVNVAGLFERAEASGVRSETSYIVGPTGLIGAVSVRNLLGTRETHRRELYVHTDQVGSLNGITDEHGRLFAKFGYAAWGETRASTGATVGGSRLNQIGFAGFRRTISPNLLFAGHRLYSTRLGMFLSPDPISSSASSSGFLPPYAYGGHNPITNFDLEGLFLDGLFDAIGDLFEGVANFISSPLFAAIVGIVVGIAVTVACAGVCSPLVAAVLSGMAAGAASAGFYAISNGASFEDALNATVTGAAFGAIGGLVGYGVTYGARAIMGVNAADYAKLTQGKTATWSGRVVSSAGRVLSGGIQSGVRNRLMGGSFEDGFRSGIAGSLTSLAWESAYRVLADDVRPRLRGATLGAQPDKKYNYGAADAKNIGVGSCAGSQECMEYNHIGAAKLSARNTFVETIGLNEGGFISRTLNYIPGFNSFAYLHDSTLPITDFNSGFLSTATWVPTFAINYAALRGAPDPDVGYLSFDELEQISTRSRR